MTSETSVHHHSFRSWLQSEFTARCGRNSSYSLRSFSLLLKMDASSVSQILAGKRQATARVIKHICHRLGTDAELTESFVQSCSYKKGKKDEVVVTSRAEGDYKLMAEDTFNLMANWYYLGILELAHVTNLKNEAVAIAQTFGLTVTEVKVALERMLRLGLLIEETGFLRRTDRLMTTFVPGQTSKAHKELQRQILTLALHALDDVPQEEKDITSMTMAIDVTKLPEARKRLTKFRRELCEFLEDGEPTQVYQLGLQLFPLSKNITNRRDT